MKRGGGARRVLEEFDRLVFSAVVVAAGSVILFNNRDPWGAVAMAVCWLCLLLMVTSATAQFLLSADRITKKAVGLLAIGAVFISGCIVIGLAEPRGKSFAFYTTSIMGLLGLGSAALAVYTILRARAFAGEWDMHGRPKLSVAIEYRARAVINIWHGDNEEEAIETAKAQAIDAGWDVLSAEIVKDDREIRIVALNSQLPNT